MFEFHRLEDARSNQIFSVMITILKMKDESDVSSAETVVDDDE